MTPPLIILTDTDWEFDAPHLFEDEPKQQTSDPLWIAVILYAWLIAVLLGYDPIKLLGIY